MMDNDNKVDHNDRRAAIMVLRRVLKLAELAGVDMEDPETGFSMTWEDSELSLLEDRIVISNDRGQAVIEIAPTVKPINKDFH